MTTDHCSIITDIIIGVRKTGQFVPIILTTKQGIYFEVVVRDKMIFLWLLSG